MPIILNLYIVQNRTIETIKTEKIDSINTILSKTTDFVDMNIDIINNNIHSISQNSGIQQGFFLYDNIVGNYREGFNENMGTHINNLNESSNLIYQSEMILKDGTNFSNKDILNEEFIYSDTLKEFKESDINHMWFFLNSSDILHINNDKYSSDEISVFNITKIYNIQETELVGFIVTFLDTDELSNIYNAVSIGDNGSILMLDSNFNALSKDEDIINTIPKDYFYDLESDYQYFERENKDYILTLEKVDSMDALLIGVIPESSLTDLIREPLRNNFYFLIIISIIISIWIFVELLILTNLATEKSKAKYKLAFSEELNEKLRIYKHDFSNHLQILKVLIDMNKQEKALKYINKLTYEGNMIYDAYEVGIPEIEASLYDTFLQCKQFNIQFDVKTINLPPNLSINIYDLIKAISNLTKNAIEAMKDIDSKDKALTFEILETESNYVFKISNNMPIIKDEIKDKIFEKGFSQKSSNTGLGLYITKEVIERNNGEFFLETDSKGNHFFILINKM